MSAAQHTPGPGIEISLRIGQRVRHCQDFKGRRVIGVIQSLYLSEGVLSAEIGLDEPLVIDGLKDSPPISLYRQNVPAHELASFDERDELIAELLAALEDARNGIRWYQDRCPEAVDGSDDEAAARIDAAIAKATGGTSS